MRIKLLALFFSLTTLVVFAQEGILSTLRFKDADIRIVLQAITQKAVKDDSKVNILVAPDIKGLVTVDLENVDWQTALDAVLRTYNYGYEWAGKNIILVDTVDNLAEKRRKNAEAKVEEPIDSKVFNLSFAKVDDVRNTIQSMISGRGRIISDSRTNTIVVSDVQSNLPNIEKAIKALDEITPQVEIEVKVVETDFDASKKLGLKWNLGTDSGGGAGTVVSGQGTSNLGAFTKTVQSKEFDGAVPNLARPFTYGTLSASNFSVAMQLLFSDSRTKILSMPRITTMDNNTATIDVVREDPLPNYTYNSERGAWEISGYNFIKYGVSLEVTPQINREGFITLTLKPKVSEKYTDKQFTGSSGSTALLPVIDTQTTVTKVMVRDNETLVIGGLIRDKTEDTINKVPILGDMPVLGYFFKHKSRTTVQKNLMIFITPRIVTPQKITEPEKAVTPEEAQGKQE